MAATLALAAGLLEGAAEWILEFIPDVNGYFGDLVPEILWIAPAVDLVLFLALAVALAAASRLFDRVRFDALALSVFLWLAVYGALSTLGILSAQGAGSIHPLARAMLATGVAVQAFLYTRRRPAVPVSTLRRHLLRISTLAVLVNLGGFGFGLQRILRSQPVGTASGSGLEEALSLTLSRRGLLSGRLLASTPAIVSRVAMPNVLLITLDTLRAEIGRAHV